MKLEKTCVECEDKFYTYIKRTKRCSDCVDKDLEYTEEANKHYYPKKGLWNLSGIRKANGVEAARGSLMYCHLC